MKNKSRIYKVKHVTSYDYAEPVSLAYHQAHLIPRFLPGQTVSRISMRISPQPAEIDEHGQDCHGNPVTYFALREIHSRLTVQVGSRVEIRSRPLPHADNLPIQSDTLNIANFVSENERVAMIDFLFESPYVPVLEPVRDYARQSFVPGRNWLDGLRDLGTRIYQDFSFDPAATTLATPMTEIIAKKRGVCQDFAHFAIACLRSIGVPARYVSGYILTKPPPGRPKLRGADASHAWLSAFLPGMGWVDIDPTNDCIPDIEHITVAWGRDYDDVSPLRGVVLGGGDHSLKVSVDVEIQDKKQIPPKSPPATPLSKREI